MSKHSGWLVAALFIVIGGVLSITTLRAMEARRVAMARADSLAVEKLEARHAADLLSDSLELEKIRTTVVLGHLAQQRQRADSLANLAASLAARESLQALETGLTLGETLATAREASTGPVAELLDTALLQLSAHLEADQRTNEAFRDQIRFISESREVALEESMNWRGRALLAERTLEARELECQSCEAEVIALRDVKDPGFFEELMGNAGKVLGGVGVGILLALVIL